MNDIDINDNSSRVEQILGTMTGDYSGTLERPLSRVEYLLLKLLEVFKTSGEKSSLKTEYVDSLPSTGDENVFYFVKKSPEDKNDPYDIYTYSNGSFIKIDNPDIDYTLSYKDGIITLKEINGTSQQIDISSLVKDYVTKEELEEKLNWYRKYNLKPILYSSDKPILVNSSNLLLGAMPKW